MGGSEKNISFLEYVGSKPIMKNPIVLHEEYLPENIEHRDKEIAWLGKNVFSAPFNSMIPEHTLVLGDSGTGKTIVLKKLQQELNTLASQRGTRTASYYLNCNNIKSAYNAIHNLLKMIGRGQNYKLGQLTDYYVDLFYEKIDEMNKKIIIILDEVEQLSSKKSDINQLLYTLLRGRSTGKLSRSWITVIIISNNIHLRKQLQQNVQSSLGNHHIIFNRYNDEQLFNILKVRANEAFNNGACPDDVLWKVAELNQDGDARKALRMLRGSAEVAQDKNRSKVTVQDVLMARKKLEESELRGYIESLKEEAQILLWIISELNLKNIKNIEGGQLYKLYKQLCNDYNREPVSRRWINQHLQWLCEIMILRGIVSKTERGQPMLYTLSEDNSPDIVLELVKPKLPKIITKSIDISFFNKITTQKKLEGSPK